MESAEHMTSYCQLIEKNNDILVISFSHIGLAAGSFAHPHALTTFPYSLLQLNCPDNSFYLCPIPGVGQDVESISCALKNRIAALGPRKVVCYGASMGAFGALLYGFLLEVDLIIALGPEVSLGLKGAPARGVAGDPAVFTHPLAKNLLKVVKTCKTRVVALFGEKATADMFGALDLHDRLADSCYSVKNAFHDLAAFIEGVYGLSRFLLETAESAQLPTAFLAEHCSDLIQHRRLVESLYGITHGDKRDSSVLEILETIPACASPETKSYAYLAAAKRFLTGREDIEGRYALRKALSLNPREIDLVTFYFGLYPEEFMSLEVREEHLLHLMNAHRCNKSPTYYRLAALMLRHQWPAAPHTEDWLAPFFVYDRQRAELAFHLAQLLEVEGDLQGAEEQSQRALDLNPHNPVYSQFQSAIRTRMGKKTPSAATPLRARQHSTLGASLSTMEACA